MVDNSMAAITVERVTGNLRPINWNKHKKKWDELKNKEIERVGPRPIIDIMIGTDYPEVHFSYKEIFFCVIFF